MTKQANVQYCINRDPTGQLPGGRNTHRVMEGREVAAKDRARTRSRSPGGDDDHLQWYFYGEGDSAGTTPAIPLARQQACELLFEPAKELSTFTNSCPCTIGGQVLNPGRDLAVARTPPCLRALHKFPPPWLLHNLFGRPVCRLSTYLASQDLPGRASGCG